MYTSSIFWSYWAKKAESVGTEMGRDLKVHYWEVCRQFLDQHFTRVKPKSTFFDLLLSVSISKGTQTPGKVSHPNKVTVTVNF